MGANSTEIVPSFQLLFSEYASQTPYPVPRPTADFPAPIAWSTMAAMSTPEKLRSRRFDSLAQEAFLNLWRTYDRLRILEDALFGRYKLTPQQYNALRLLRRELPGNLPTLVLASRLVSRAPDITRLLDRLVKRGLIERERRPDNRRVVRVGITPAGLELLKTMEADIKACHDRQLGHLSQEQLQQLISLLREARRPHEPPESTWL